MSKHVPGGLKPSAFGPIPEAWDAKLLNDIVLKILDFRGRTPKKLDMEWGGGSIKALSANNVRMGYIDFSRECNLGTDALYSKWMTQGDCAFGDILITMEAPLGKVAQIPDNKKYILSQRIVLIKTKQNLVVNDYLKHFMMGTFFQFLLSENSTGTTAQGIQQKRLVELDVLLPPLPEQRKIAAVLSSADRSIAATEKLIAKIADLKKALMQQLLTKGIGHTEFKPSPLGPIPNSWEVRKLHEIATINDGAHQTPTYTEKGKPFLRVTDIQSQNIDFASIKYIPENEHYELTRRCKPEKGDILLSKNGTIGIVKVVTWDWDFSIFVSLALIKIMKKDCVHLWYLSKMLESPSIRQQIKERAKQGTVTNLHLEEIREFDILIPPIEEQLKIADILNGVDRKLAAAKVKLAKAKDLKQGLMNDLLTGKVRVSA